VAKVRDGSSAVGTTPQCKSRPAELIQ
jgi:hypothetical protein